MKPLLRLVLDSFNCTSTMVVSQVDLSRGLCNFRLKLNRVLDVFELDLLVICPNHELNSG